MQHKRTEDYIFHDMRKQIGGDEETRLYTITTIKTGKTEVVVEKTLTQRMPIQKLAKAEDLYERLTCSAGRKLYKPEDIAHPFNPGEE